MTLLLDLVGILLAFAALAGGVLFVFGGKQWRDRVSMMTFIVCAAVVVLSLLVVLFFVGSSAYQTFTVKHVTLAQFFLGKIWYPDNGQVGAVIPIVGTLTVTLLAVLVSAPISVGLAVFVTEVAPTWARRLMQPVLELFTGIPSIIYGFLGIELVVPLVRNIYNTIAGGFLYAGFGVIAAAIVLAIMIMPTIASISIDTLASLPRGLREASLALGATRWQTIRRTLIPASTSGIFTGIILGTGRAIGETLAVALVIGSNPGSFPIAFTSYYPYIVFNPTSAITVQIFQDFKEATPGSLDYDAVWTLAFVLLVVSLLLVMVSRYIASRGVYSQTASRRSKKTAPASTVARIA